MSKPHLTLLLSILAATGMAAAGPASAQNWDVSAAIYGWGPDTSVSLATPLGEVEGTLSFADAWEALDLAFMGVISADRGKLGFILDTAFFRLSDSRATPGVLGFSGADLRTDVNVTNAYVTWQVHASGGGRLDVGAGLRFYDTQSSVTLTGGPAPTSFSIDDDWIDPVIALRYRTDFGPNWYGTFFADVGGFGVGSEFTLQGVALVGYRVTESFSIEGGYRVLQSNRIEANGDIDIQMSGLVIGGRWQF